ncbi:SOS response-associated peptidase family protein [Aurantiacibacter gangjinensis]|uniref:SOS response-associated peptidase family protein n=1 Tax=Aurantiacibacter gangjinensis TaxID=502682 RepID=UPI00069C29F2|nr:SOS response-associated peptidase family protein [Aurantiacibacter gangjinensis]
MSLPDSELFAVAGVWRDSDEWGHSYSMVMTDAIGGAAEVHNRTPVILAPEDREVWKKGSPQDAYALCQPREHILRIERTSEPWRL